MDHPRACGENNGGAYNVTSGSGSPPRVRGKRRTAKRTGRGKRITPARAGKTSCFAVTFRSRAGSPPRVRGKRYVRRRSIGVERITPARAGKTCNLESSLGALGDHPRAYGENMQRNPYMIRYKGSPPRVRGKRAASARHAYRKRITPARAGKTHRVEHGQGNPEDHPRACGENIYTQHSRHQQAGSPPRVRGKRVHLR